METSQARRWRWLIFASAVVEMFLFSGILFGWGSLVFVLKQDGVFSHLCSEDDATKDTNTSKLLNISFVGKKYAGDLGAKPRPDISYSDVTNLSTNQTMSSTISAFATEDRRDMTPDGWLLCEAQDDMLSLCFTITSATLYCATSIAGTLSYKLGTRITRLVGWLSFTVGSLLTAYTSPGLSPLAFGGIVLLITDIQIGTLFARGGSTVIATMCGLFDTSSVVMLFLKFAHEAGFSRRDIFLLLCGLHILTLLNTLLLRPRAHFTWLADEEHSAGIVVDSEPLNESISNLGDCDRRLTTSDTKDELTTEQSSSQAQKSNSLPTLRECLLSPVFVLEVAWMALLQLRFSFFLASLNPWLTFLFKSQEEVSHYTNVSQYSLMTGLAISLISGATFDICKYVFAKHAVPKCRHLYPTVILLSITSGLGVMLSVMMLIHTKPVTHAALLFAALLRSFLYSVDSNVITLMFPARYFGALFAVSDFIGGAISMLQYALTVWYQSAGFHIVNRMMLAVTAVTFIHPLVQLWRGQQMTRRHNSVQTEDVDLTGTVVEEPVGSAELTEETEAL